MTFYQITWSSRVKALLIRHLEGMHANSPPGQVFALDWSELQKPEISFYALWEGEDLLGVGALKQLEPRYGEIKSMRTTDAHLRKGVAAAILDHLVAEARRRGCSRRTRWRAEASYRLHVREADWASSPELAKISADAAPFSRDLRLRLPGTLHSP